jgi:hypothetical protein
MIELLYITDCPGVAETDALLRRVLAEEGRAVPVTKISVDTPAQAAATRFLGSPTVRVNGRDIEATRAEEPGGVLGCRLYAMGRGASNVPPEALIRAAIRALPATPGHAS